MNIIKGDQLASSNRIFKARANARLCQGGKCKEFAAIEENELKPIFPSFDKKSGETLQNEVTFCILQARDREKLVQVMKSILALNRKKSQNSEPSIIGKAIEASLQNDSLLSEKRNGKKCLTADTFAVKTKNY